MKTLDWFGLHGESWGQEICPESYSHPAKYARALIRRIYEYALGCGWLAEGDAVLDPFAGVGLGGLDAMFQGLHWMGVELEEKFVDLGGQNIALWNRRYNNGMLPRWGTAVIVQGDSRNLLDVLGGARAQACVSSPPYAASATKGARENRAANLEQAGIDSKRWLGKRRCTQGRSEGYGPNPRNLANMREGDHEAVVKACIGSPPYIGSINQSDEANDADARIKRKAAAGVDVAKPVNIGGPNSVLRRPQVYGSTSGQLGAMPEGDMVKATEYTYNPGSLTPTQFDAKAVAESITFTAVPKQEEAIECEWEEDILPEGAFEAKAVVSSPGYGGSEASDKRKTMNAFLRGEGRTGNRKASRGNLIPFYHAYSTEGNICSEEGDTFWSAARQIVEQCWLALAPGGYAVWVLKAFVRNKAIVDFPDQWRRMCESVGFVMVEWIRAWLVEDRGAQWALDGELVEKEVRRESFFRRLHRQKYPELSIDYEVVLVMRKSEAI